MLIIFDLDYTLFNTNLFKKDLIAAHGNAGKLFASADSYVFADTDKLLKKLKTEGHSLMLYSFGDKGFQSQKIKNLDIKKYFSKIIITNKEKSKSLKFVKTKSLIVNDNAKESIAMRNELKQSEIFLIRGPYSQNTNHSLKVHDNINDLIKLKLICMR